MTDSTTFHSATTRLVVAMTDASAGLPSWAPWAFGAMILVTLVVVILQAVRYFRNNRDD